MPLSLSGTGSTARFRRSRIHPPPRRSVRGSVGSRFIRCLNRNRRLAIALLLSAAAGLTVHQLAPAPADTVTAVAAARDLPAGAALAGPDIVAVKVPPGVVPSGSFTDSAEVQGKQLAAPIRKGQLLADAQLLGPGLLTGTAAGSAAVPLRMADPSSVQLVSPGQLVNVVL